MPAHPIPPTLPRDRAEFEAHYAKDPDQWFQYLSDAYTWMEEQEANQTTVDRKLVELQVQVEALQGELQLSQARGAEATSQKNWIVERLDAKEKELAVVRLELYKAQTAAFPTLRLWERLYRLLRGLPPPPSFQNEFPTLTSLKLPAQTYAASTT
ncbi:hypothetical protein BFJ66_g4023, partial [Fusarium oxysporum f. sp. cepae]